MAGVYIHVPYCRQACHYCDFHFSVNRANQPQLVQALVREAAMRTDYLQEAVQTIYLGGGTPSLLTVEQLTEVLGAIRQYYSVAPNAEVTLEANPDDVTPALLEHWLALGVNRLSMGLQSFHQPFLEYMNRAHHAGQSLSAVRQAQAAGFDNISVDLIYGLPAEDHDLWQRDLDQAFSLGVTHLSAYALTIEPATVFGRRLAKGQLQTAPDDFVATQFQMLREQALARGWEHYEVSNLARPGRYSRHNTAYWQGRPYLGLGPAAHSFNGESRSYNVSSNNAYIDSIAAGDLPQETETLSAIDKANEYLMTSLRTQWGMRVQTLFDRSGLVFSPEQHSYLLELLADGLATSRNGAFILTGEGLLLADRIAMELFFEAE